MYCILTLTSLFIIFFSYCVYREYFRNIFCNSRSIYKSYMETKFIIILFFFVKRVSATASMFLIM